MTDVSFDTATANGLLKPVFGGIVDSRIPANYLLSNLVAYNKEKKLGELLQELVWLTEEQGITLNAGSGVVYTLNDSESAISKKLSASGAEITVKSTVAIKLLAAAQGAGPKAFLSALSGLTANMLRTMRRSVEIESCWGSAPTGIGAILARTVDAGTSQTFSINMASWAPGIWAGAEKMFVDVYSAAGPLGTKRNTSGTMQVTGIVHPTGSTEGTVKFLGTEAEMDNVTAGDIIVPRGAVSNTTGPVYAQQVGLMTSAANAGTYLGIDGSSSGYSQWAGNSFSVGSTDLTWDKVEQMVGMAVGKGLDGPAHLLVSIRTWSVLNMYLNQLRKIDSSYSKDKTTIGTKSISYISQNGELTVHPYHFMKFGSALLIPANSDGEEPLGRYGSSDITFEIPDEGGKYMRIMSGSGVEFRAWTDQLLVNRAPAKCVVATGIVNS